MGTNIVIFTLPVRVLKFSTLEKKTINLIFDYEDYEH